MFFSSPVIDQRRGMMKKTVGVAVTLALITGCSGSAGQLPAKPEETAQVKSVVWSGPAAMATGSDLVVLARVTAVNPGPSVGEVKDEMKLRELTLGVEKVLFTRDSSPTEIKVTELGWVSGVPTQVEDVPWGRVGDRSYYFLQKTESNRFATVGPQGTIGLQDGKLVPAGSKSLKAVVNTIALTPASLEKIVSAEQEKYRKNPNTVKSRGDGDAS
jgi:hypothetical protein